MFFVIEKAKLVTQFLKPDKIQLLFQKPYYFLQVCSNGIISLNITNSDYTPDPFPQSSASIISPFWRDFDLSSSGKLYVRETNNSNLLKFASAAGE